MQLAQKRINELPNQFLKSKDTANCPQSGNASRVVFSLQKDNIILPKRHLKQSLSELTKLENMVEYALTLEAYGQRYLADHHLANQEEGHKLLSNKHAQACRQPIREIHLLLST